MRWLLVVGGLLLAAGGATAAFIGMGVDPRDALIGWHMALMFGTTTAVGGLFLLMLTHVAQASWAIVLRRLMEHLVGSLPVLALLFVPSLLYAEHLYPWAEGGIEMHHHVAESVRKKRAWLNDDAFVMRSVGYLAALTLVGELLRHWSRAQDHADTEAARTRYGRRMRVLSAVGFPLLGLTITFAWFDWIMSLEPAWYSAIYGVAVLSGGFVAAVGVLAVSMVVARRRGMLEGVEDDHRHAVGRVLFASLCFWAYLHFSQYLLIWIADLPHEVRYFITRQEHGWQWLGLVIVGAHFVLPFFAMLSKELKKRPGPLALFGVWMVLSHLLAVYYLVIPAHRHELRVHWVDVAALAAVVGVMLAFAALRSGRMRPMPVGDPGLAASLDYSSS